MSLETDHIVDRRRMRRKVTFWRVVAFLIAIIAVVGIAPRRSTTSPIPARPAP
jgi:protease-4